MDLHVGWVLRLLVLRLVGNSSREDAGRGGARSRVGVELGLLRL